MDTAPGNTVGVIVEGVHEMHRPDKERFFMELAKRLVIMFDESIVDQFLQIDPDPLDLFFGKSLVDPAKTRRHRQILPGLAGGLELLRHQICLGKELIHIDKPRDRDDIPVIVDKSVGGRPAVGMGAEHDLGLSGICLDQITDRHYRRDRIEIGRLQLPAHLFLDTPGDIRDRDPFTLHIIRFCRAGESDGLEVDPADDIDILRGKLDDAPDLMIVLPVNDRRDKHYAQTGFPAVLDRRKTGLFQKRVRLFGNTVKVEIHRRKSCLTKRLCQLGILGKLDPV